MATSNGKHLGFFAWGFLWLLESSWPTSMAGHRCQGVNILHFYPGEQSSIKADGKRWLIALSLVRINPSLCSILQPRIAQRDQTPLGHSNNKVFFCFLSLPHPTTPYPYKGILPSLSICLTIWFQRNQPKSTTNLSFCFIVSLLLQHTATFSGTLIPFGSLVL